VSGARVVVVGGMNVDVKARSAATVVPGTSNPGSVVRSAGGVGRNVAENLARLGTPTALVSAVGADADGTWLVAATQAAGVDVSAVARTAVGTGTYAAVLDADGELVVAVSAMAAADALGAEHLPAEVVARAELLVLDGNLPTATVAAALALAAAHGVRVVVEPVSVPKAARLAPLLDHRVFAVTPNRAELAALGSTAALHDAGVEVVWVRDGADGSEVSGPDGVTRLAAPPADVVDVTGAGDAMLAAFCHRLLLDGDLAAAAADGHRAAALTVASPHTVLPDLAERMGS
jgi:pseudouridine kinase